MFYTLLIVTFGVALLVSCFASLLFTKPADAILRRVIQDEIYKSWLTYLKFALYVVGISSGVRIFDLERFITATLAVKGGQPIELTPERWVLEVYRTVIGTLQGLAWVLLVFFVLGLVAFVCVKVVEVSSRAKAEKAAAQPPPLAGRPS